MAKRPVFVVCENLMLFETVYIEFAFNPGFSSVQKQKNIVALHESYRRACGEEASGVAPEAGEHPALQESPLHHHG